MARQVFQIFINLPFRSVAGEILDSKCTVNLHSVNHKSINQIYEMLKLSR